jgi:hypothetical protein
MLLTWFGKVFELFFIVALCHVKAPDLNSCLAHTSPACNPELARAAIRVGSARRKFKFEKIIII